MENGENVQDQTDALIALLRLSRDTSWAEDEDIASLLIETSLKISPAFISRSETLRREMITTTRALLRAEDWQTAESAAERLGMLKAVEAVPDLIAIAEEHEETKVRLTAIESLGHVGANSIAAKNALSLLSRDPNQAIAGTAKMELEVIRAGEEVNRHKHSFSRDQPPGAVALMDLYTREEFSSFEERTNFLEKCMSFLAGTISVDELESFIWPSTHVSAEGSGLIDTHDFEPIGMLSHFGYRVGKNGISETTRRSILERIFFERSLPKINSAAYVEEWGQAKTGKRLRKMAESIAAFCRNAKRRNSADMAESVDGWQRDLAWLKEQFYDGRFEFVWPKGF
jgi:hypothetical protein